MDNFITYLIVFLVVFVPYVFFQTFMDIKGKNFNKSNTRNLPRFYDLTYSTLSPFINTLGVFLQNLFPNTVDVIKNKLLIADIKMDVRYVLVAQVLLSLFMLLVSLLFIVSTQPKGLMGLLLPVMVLCIAWIYPRLIIEKLAEQRQIEIIKALPFAIDLIGSAMRAGLDFSAAIRYYVSIADPKNPLTIEFKVVLRQMELAKTRVESLENMVQRVQVDTFTSFTAAIIHGSEVGSSIVETIMMQGEEMRKARFNIAEQKAARAPSLMVLPIALFIMPAFFIMIGAPIYLRMQNSGLGGIF